MPINLPLFIKLFPSFRNAMSKLENGKCESPDEWSLFSLVTMVSHLVLSLSLLVYSALFLVKSYFYHILVGFLLVAGGQIRGATSYDDVMDLR